MRLALELAYDGSHYHGWQRQSDAITTVQQHVERAIGVVASEPVTVTCAGRTDTGVHALSQVVHFDTQATNRTSRNWIRGTNANLPDDISVVSATRVADDFDARRSAISRRYIYLIDNQRHRHALFNHQVSRHHRPLDEQQMHEAAQYLLGENDFSSFRAAHCQSLSPMRDVKYVSVTRRHDLVVVEIIANAFLHHMVRNIVGVLMDVGAGAKPVGWMPELLALRDRTKASATAPPNGLYLAEVSYPATCGLHLEGFNRHFFGLLAE